MLSSPKDYPIPPLKIKEKTNNYYKAYRLQGPGEPMAIAEPEEKHSAVKRRYRKHDYISSPKLRNPRLAPIRLLHIPINLLWIYERAKEKQEVKDALRRRRFARKKDKSLEKVVVEVIEIPQLDPTSRNVVEVGKTKGRSLY
jgi:hypothetical protein